MYNKFYVIEFWESQLHILQKPTDTPKPEKEDEKTITQMILKPIPDISKSTYSPWHPRGC